MDFKKTRQTLDQDNQVDLSEAAESSLKQLEKKLEGSVEFQEMDERLSKVAEVIVDVERKITTDFIKNYLTRPGNERDKLVNILAAIASPNPSTGLQLMAKHNLDIKHIVDSNSNFLDASDRTTDGYAREMRGQELTDHIIETIDDMPAITLADGSKLTKSRKASLLETMLRSRDVELPAKAGTRESALHNAKYADKRLQSSTTRNTIADKMKSGKFGLLKDIVTNIGNRAVKVQVGSGFLEVPNSMISKLRVKYATEHNGDVYAIMTNGPMQTLAIIDGATIKSVEIVSPVTNSSYAQAAKRAALLDKNAKSKTTSKRQPTISKKTIEKTVTSPRQTTTNAYAQAAKRSALLAKNPKPTTVVNKSTASKSRPTVVKQKEIKTTKSLSQYEKWAALLTKEEEERKAIQKKTTRVNQAPSTASKQPQTKIETDPIATVSSSKIESPVSDQSETIKELNESRAEYKAAREAEAQKAKEVEESKKTQEKEMQQTTKQGGIASSWADYKTQQASIPKTSTTKVAPAPTSPKRENAANVEDAIDYSAEKINVNQVALLGSRYSREQFNKTKAEMLDKANKEQNEIKTLEEGKRNLRGNLSNLKQDWNTNLNTIATQKDLIKIKEEAVSNIENTIDEYEATRKKVVFKKPYRKEQIAIKEEEKEQIKKEIEAANRKINELSNQNTKLSNDIADLESKIRRNTKKITVRKANKEEYQNAVFYMDTKRSTDKKKFETSQRLEERMFDNLLLENKLKQSDVLASNVSAREFVNAFNRIPEPSIKKLVTKDILTGMDPFAIQVTLRMKMKDSFYPENHIEQKIGKNAIRKMMRRSEVLGRGVMNLKGLEVMNDPRIPRDIKSVYAGIIKGERKFFKNERYDKSYILASRDSKVVCMFNNDDVLVGMSHVLMGRKVGTGSSYDRIKKSFDGRTPGGYYLLLKQPGLREPKYGSYGRDHYIIMKPNEDQYDLVKSGNAYKYTIGLHGFYKDRGHSDASSGCINIPRSEMGYIYDHVDAPKHAKDIGSVIYVTHDHEPYRTITQSDVDRYEKKKSGKL